MTWGEQNTEAEAHEQLDLFLSMGGNFIDTAELYPVPPKQETYGRTEFIIGRWLAQDPSRREKIILATKVVGPGIFWYPAIVVNADRLMLFGHHINFLHWLLSS